MTPSACSGCGNIPPAGARYCPVCARPPLNPFGLKGTAVFVAIALALVGAISVILGPRPSSLAAQSDGRRLGSVAAV